jgi:hypothetical protein
MILHNYITTLDSNMAKVDQLERAQYSCLNGYVFIIIWQKCIGLM